MEKNTLSIARAAAHSLVPVVVLILGWGFLSPMLVSSTNDLAVVLGFTCAIGTLFLAGIYAGTTAIPAIKAAMKEDKE